MKERSISIQKQENNQLNNSFCLFIPGALATDQGLRFIRRHLEKLYPESRVPYSTLSLDIVRSSEWPLPERFKKMAETISTSLQNGKTVDVFVHSAGATELVKVIDELERYGVDLKTNPDLAKRIRLILISPAGFFQGLAGSFDYFKRVLKLGLSLTRFPNVYRGVESLIFFPLSNENDIDPNDLLEALRLSLPEYSLLRRFNRIKKESQEMINPPQSPFSPNFNQRQKERLIRIDSLLTDLLKKVLSNKANSKEIKMIKKILKRRSRLLQKEINRVYAGKIDEIEKSGERFNPLKVPLRTYCQAFLGISSLVIDIFSGKSYQTINQLRSNGIQVFGVIPEYDIMVPPEIFEDFIHLFFLSGYTHSAIGPLPNFSEIIKS